MKNVIIISLINLIISLNLFSQENIYNNKFTVNSQYLLVKFIDGKVKFNDGYEMNAKLNYNVLLEEMHFLKNDTIRTLTSNDIKYIILDKFKFISIDGKFIQDIYNTKDLKLIFQYNPDISSIGATKGAYGSSTETAATTKINSIPSQSMYNNGYVVLKDDDAEEIKTYPKYYIVNSNKNIISPTKKKIHKLSKKSKEDIEYFIKENRINFNNKEDLIKILDFL